jgi:hypothetical protein
VEEGREPVSVPRAYKRSERVTRRGADRCDIAGDNGDNGDKRDKSTTGARLVAQKNVVVRQRAP